MKKIIFLDIDGVMNSEVDFLLTGKHEEAHDISGRCVGLLNELVKETEAEIVISSVWRYNNTKEDLQALFDSKGFIGKIIDVTPIYSKEYTVRGNEILGWIKANEKYLEQSYSDFNAYIIFDDDSDMLYWQRENFILIDGFTGLTRNKIYKAKRMLNRYA